MNLFTKIKKQPDLTDIYSDWFPSLILAVYVCVSAISSFYMAVYFKENLGYTGSQIGILFSIQAVTGILASLPTGIINDHVTSRTLIVISLLVQSICIILMAVVNNFIWFMGVFFWYSLFVWGFRQSIDVQFLKIRSKKEMGKRIGFYQVWRFIGATIGTIGSGYLISKFDFKLTLITVGIILLLMAIPSAMLAPTPISKVRMSDYLKDISNRKVLFFASWMLVFGTHWGAEQTCYGIFLREKFYLSMNHMGLYFGAEFIAIICIMIFIGSKVHKNDNAQKITIYGLLGSGIGHIGMVLDPISVSVFFRIIHGFGDGCLMMIFYYGIYKLFSIEHLGGNSGLMNLSSMIGYVLGSLVYGPIGEYFGYSYPLWISGVTTIMLIYPFISKRFQHLAFSSEM